MVSPVSNRDRSAGSGLSSTRVKKPKPFSGFVVVIVAFRLPEDPLERAGIDRPAGHHESPAQCPGSAGSPQGLSDPLPWADVQEAAEVIDEEGLGLARKHSTPGAQVARRGLAFTLTDQGKDQGQTKRTTTLRVA